jgi:predicted RNA-binding Zn ribbon-like protein
VGTRRASLPAWQRRLLVSGSVALDVAHTGGLGGWVDADLVVDEQALGYWLAVLLERDVSPGSGLVEFRSLREALFTCAQRHVAGEAFRPADVTTINRFAGGPPLPVELTVDGSAVCRAATVDQALAHIAREAIALFTGPLRERVRTCAAADCQLLFVDASRPGRRQWCSMARCGNLAKTRAYRGRTR